MMMEAESTSETAANFFHTIHRNNTEPPENSISRPKGIAKFNGRHSRQDDNSRKIICGSI
jgi:hypothetical protein